MMEGVGSEVSHKIRSAIKAKLVELGTYVDEELPDYIMVLVANKKTKDQMDDDLSLFLGHNTERFTSWLHHVLQKLNAAALLQVTSTQQQPEEPKKKDIEEEKRREREDEKKRERDEEKKREKAEEMKRMRDEEKRKVKEKEKTDKKRKSSERKVERKEKKVKKSTESPDSQDKAAKERKAANEPVKQVKVKDSAVKEKESKERVRTHSSTREEPTSTDKVSSSVAAVAAPETASTNPEKNPRKLKSHVRGKVSCAEIFRAEAMGGGEQLKEEEEEDIVEDMLVLRADVDELGLELEEEPVPKKIKLEQRQKITAPRIEGRVEVKTEAKIDSKVETKQKIKCKPDSGPARVSAKERLGAAVFPKSEQPRDKPSILDRLGSAPSSGRRVINLREESSFPPRPESSSSSSNTGMARAVSSAISSAHRSVCALPSSSSSTGKKLEARVRPLMSKQVESSHEGSGREASTRDGAQSREESSRESFSRSVSGRVVSAVGAVLRRPHSQVNSDEEEYDPKKPQLSGMASKVEVTPRPRRPGAIQANTALILRAMADAHKSVNRPCRRSADKPEVPQKKQKGKLYTRSYREREQARQKDIPPQEEAPPTEDEVRIRKIAITVPNATRKESEKQLKEEKKDKEVPVMPDIISTTEVIEKDEVIESSSIVAQEEEEYGPALPDNGYGLEEVEEVEEEVVDEGIEEDQPNLPTVSQHHKLHAGPGVENTKFIVTLEGVDTGVFSVKDDLRSRLGSPPAPTDSLEVVEEYIEEVEELEEEEEETTIEICRETIQPVVGHSAGVKSRLKGVASVMSGSNKERCRFWPLCKAGESCPYHHPTVQCKKMQVGSFPTCKFGDKCLYVHPNCLFDGACTRMGCPYTHASSRNLALASAVVTQKHKIVAQARPSKIKCKFFPKCTNMACPFLHPKACYYGASCAQPNCPFTHPPIPRGAKLKWIAPKATTAPVSTTDASLDKVKEIERQDPVIMQ
ncbi:zinc finger CCCH domain-containing protein 14-like isoform X2 [Homarus americanus]|uniref:zinc finger CCCH domain-containing protein 14-like isoform X2 n=1 Tax=Homarus americanus TaxID=6706 RepID=UPI001C43D53E|nr:zinc finger CCCH domain-containing protein 14-like isoform X2 [Homarus americanus]